MPDYPRLFANAFDDPQITPVRIAFAIASYERTLVADQTDWDRFEAGDTDALTATERYGWDAFRNFQCVACHTPPLFTNNDYANIGLRRSEYDRGRQNVTGDPEDSGEFRVPTLRNAALKSRFMHTGEFPSLAAAVAFYRNGPALPDRDDLPTGGIYAFNMGQLNQADLVEFIRGALIDPRVAGETFPFDRPTLRSERE
jgi:cytochrome c peroxidase